MEGPLPEEEQRVLDEFVSKIEQASGKDDADQGLPSNMEERPQSPKSNYNYVFLVFFLA